MASLLEKSLDDIIGENKLARIRSKPRTKSRGSRSSDSNRVTKSSAQKPTRKSIPAARGLHLPRDITQLSSGRPVIRIRNIHLELNGDDILSLFGTINPVDFVKFDSHDDSIAYLCFQRDCARSNSIAIASFDGKKAMGQVLIVESAVSLADRITSKANVSQSLQSRGRERNVDGARPKKEKPPRATADSLDAELDSYMNQGKSLLPESENVPV